MHLVLLGRSPFRYKRLFRYIRLGYNGSLLYIGNNLTNFQITAFIGVLPSITSVVRGQSLGADLY